MRAVFAPFSLQTTAFAGRAEQRRVEHTAGAGAGFARHLHALHAKHRALSPDLLARPAAALAHHGGALAVVALRHARARAGAEMGVACDAALVNAENATVAT